MNKLIRTVCTSLDHETYVYFKEGFQHDYYVFGDGGYWIVIIGENGIMETIFPPDSYRKYLDAELGYHFLGTVKEVLEHG
jgi:hypothetical protein